MKSMNVVGIFFISFLFTQCKSTKLDVNPPFKVTKATVLHWIGGIEGVSGTNVFVYVDTIPKITLKQLFFQDKVVNIQKTKDEKGNPIIAGFFTNTPKNNISNLNLHADTVKEFTNTLPDAVKNLPFKLKENEALISYKKGKKTYYFKVENIVKAPQQFYK